MDSALPETIVLEIVTNLNTRFVVVPLRSLTVGDVSGTIKSFHMDLFPEWGEVEVISMEIAGKYRLEDCLPIRHLFWNAPLGTVFAELIPSTTYTIGLPRLNVAGATVAKVVSNPELHQNPAESKPSPRRKGLAEGQSILSLGNSGDRKSDLDRKVVDGTHGHGSKPEVVERSLRTMKRGVDKRGSLPGAGERQVKAECAAVDVRKPAAEKICDDWGNPVSEHFEPETGVLPDSQSVRKSMLVVEPTTGPASCGRPGNGEHLQLRKGSLPEPCPHSSPPVLDKDLEIALPLLEPVEKDAAGNGARALDTSELNATDVAQRCETGHPITENLLLEPGLGNPKDLDDIVRDTIKGMKKEAHSGSNDTSVSGSLSESRTGSQDGIVSGRQADLTKSVLSTPERRVPSGGSPNPNGVFEDCEVKTNSREMERLESDMSSGSVGSESENIESSSEDTEERDQTPPTGRRKMDFTSPKHGSGVARSSGRRSLGGSKYKYQNLQEDGSDELINLCQQKSTVISGSQQELQPPAEAQHSLAPVSLADDSHPKDLIRDKEDGKCLISDEQVITTSEAVEKKTDDSHPKDLIRDKEDGKCLISDEQVITTSEAVEKKTDDSHPKDLIRDKEDGKCLISDEQVITTSEAVEKKTDTKPTQENVTVRRSFRQKEKRTAASLQDVRKGEERLQGRSGPPTSVKLGEGNDLREEVIPSEGVTEKCPEPGEEPPPQARSEDSQKIREALQLARMSATNLVDSNVQTPSKMKTRRKKRISRSVEGPAVTQSQTVHEESIQHKEPHIRGESVDLLPEGDDQRLEADLLLSPDQIVAVAEGLGKVLPASEATQEINKPGSAIADENQIDATGKVASGADVGRKKQRKRSHKVCQSNTEVTQQDTRGYRTSEPSQDNKEMSGKTPKKRILATDHVAIENIVLGLQQDLVPESLNKDARERAEEKKAGKLDSRWVCTICDPSTSYTKKGSLTRHLLRVHNLEKDNIPSELLQLVELQKEVENLSQLHEAVNQKDSAMGGKRLLEDTEPPNLGFEDLSQRASIDDEIEKEGRRVTGPAEEFGSQEGAEVQFKGAPAQSKQRRRKLSVEFSEDPSRLKKSRKCKKDRDSNQDPSRNHSAPLPEEVDLVTDKVVQVQETEKEEREGEEKSLVLEGKRSNTDQENEADEKYTAVMNENKDSKRVRKSSKSSKKARNLEIPLMTDVTIGRGGRQAEDVTIPFESVSVEPAEIDLPRESPENLQVQHTTVLKTKRKKSNNLDPSREGRNSGGHQAELADDMNQIATQESQKVPTTANLQDGNAKEGNKKSRKEKLQQLGFLREEGGSLRNMKDSNSKNSENGKFANSEQITFSGGNLPGKWKSKAKKRAEGGTGDSSKRKAKARITPAKSAKPIDCPHGCGKDWSKKSSAYFRHIKACPLGPGPQIA